uniref:Uncharacterized protein n=1 Tax=Anguilla anguilla TaxID=7936 RepID=A0A0E9R3E8_ANGAN
MSANVHIYKLLHIFLQNSIIRQPTHKYRSN